MAAVQNGAGAAPALDTVAAIATAAGAGGIGVLRISGPLSRSIAATMSGRKLPPRRAALATFRDAAGVAIDRGIAFANGVQPFARPPA